MKIDFICVGPQRTASTWLYQNLQLHTELCFPDGVKETFFFDQNYDKGLDWYLWHFRKAIPQQLSGEIAATYFDCPDTAQRICSNFPDCKIVINIRNPVEKTLSVFRHYCASGLVPNDFELAIKKCPRIIDSGKYRKHSMIWEDLFANRIKYIFMEDIRQNPQQVLNELTDFLNISSFETGSLLKNQVNAATAPKSPQLIQLIERCSKSLRRMKFHGIVNLGKTLGLRRLYSGGKLPDLLTQQQTENLYREYEEDIRWLEKRANRDLTHWRS